MNQRAKSIIVFSAAAFLLNFLWESWHAIYLYKDFGSAAFDVKEYISLIGYVSIVDMLILLGIAALGAFLWKQFFWFKKMSAVKYWYVVLSAAAIAVAIEIKGVYVFHQWAYSELMPTIFGIGLSPLLQLAVTGLLGLWLVRNICLHE
ncbi:MAG: hypothetical protein BMS9Abin13_096 [Patescibacteria group bacterium]|nr:MAG: hypothetical protein BMS9Abin13_096 [Patescibacteria group bacterium]